MADTLPRVEPPTAPRVRRWRDWLLRVLFPAHWSFLLSQVALWSFLLLTVTGLVLLVFYRPGVEPVLYTGSSSLYDGQVLPRAFASVVRIDEDVPGGQLVRRVHRLATYTFLASLVAHLLRVVLQGASRKPRRTNHALGVLLLVVAIGLGYTGENLPYDVVGGTSLQVASAIASSLPLLGEEFALLFFGPEVANGPGLTRLYLLHVLALPVVLLAGTALHLHLVARQSHTRLPVRVAAPRLALVAPLARSALLGLLVTAVVLAGASLAPWADVALAGPYRVGQATNTLGPDWFMFFTEGGLRVLPAVDLAIGPVRITNVLLGAVLLPGLLIGLALVYPLLESLWHRPVVDPDVLEHPLDVPSRFGLVTAWFTALVVLSLGATQDFVARTGVPVSTVVYTLRTALVVAPVALGLAAWEYARRQEPRWVLPPGETGTRAAAETGRSARA